MGKSKIESEPGSASVKSVNLGDYSDVFTNQDTVELSVQSSRVVSSNYGAGVVGVSGSVDPKSGEIEAAAAAFGGFGEVAISPSETGFTATVGVGGGAIAGLKVGGQIAGVVELELEYNKIPGYYTLSVDGQVVGKANNKAEVAADLQLRALSTEDLYQDPPTTTNPTDDNGRTNPDRNIDGSLDPRDIVNGPDSVVNPESLVGGPYGGVTAVGGGTRV